MLICNKKNALRLIISTTLFSVPLMTYATDHHDDHDGHDHSEHSEHSEHRQHDAHVHGVVETNIAQDGEHLLFEITAPGSDVVGFEHAPKNKEQEQEQEQLLEQAIAKLKTPNAIFSLPKSANCEISDIHVSHNMKNEDNHDHHDDDSHHEEHQGEHGEFTAQYEYHCETMSELNQIETQWFSVFSHTQKMTVQYLGDSGQKAATLTAKKAALAL
ncbi:zinc uptake protein ZrgA [Aliivibrio wodanis]|uniref:zinc uptake protein ZrgA n=1 Tax=Aliivibrio wodanis TaxID=80852 RepID=UPI00406C5C28